MQFEEENALTINKHECAFIYFLLKNKEVVYVGQTKVGLARPFSHRDKDYDEIKIIYCDSSELDITEDKYIQKYKPIYNKQNNYAVRWNLMRVRNNIRELFNMPDYTMFELKKVLEKLSVIPEKNYRNGNQSISFNEYVAAVNYIKSIGR